MNEAKIGRVLVASLHQAIADLLPTRLDFYENWLNTSGLRDGTIGLAPITAVLSFLRREGAAYDLIVTRAGQYAADWSVAGLPNVKRAMVRALPASLRARAVLWLAGAMIRHTYAGSRAIVKLRRGTAVVDIRGSLFCVVREATDVPLCGFYAAAITRFLRLFDLEADAQVSRCRASGAHGCILSVVVRGAPTATTSPVAA